MFENSKWINGKKDYGNAPRIYFKDLNIIKPLRRAVLNITAAGVYNVFIGKEKAGDIVLAPGCTYYTKHLMYQSYDITELVAESDFLYISVASGWYSGRINRQHEKEDKTLDYAIIAQIDLEFAGGLTQTIVTDENWSCGIGNIVSSDIYDGEICDANILPNFTDEVKVIEANKNNISPQMGEYIKEHEIFAPKAIFKTPNGETVVDFGINLTGYVFFENLTAKKGETVDLSFGEVLDKNGNFYNENYRTAKSVFKYICRDGLQNYKPQHTFYGFRYVKINSFPKDADISLLRAVDVYSDIKRMGYFNCGFEPLNKLYENTIRGQKGNFLDVPTDCPQRDERYGWTGDAQVFCKTAMFNFNVYEFFDKWLYDMSLQQTDKGEISNTVPLGFGNPSSAWGDACVIIPWTMYEMYGNKEILNKCLPMMKKWVDFCRKDGSEEFLWLGHAHFGDWLGLDAKEGDYTGSTDKDFIASAFFAHSCLLTAKAMEAVGENSEEYLALYNNILAAFKEKYGTYTETQTACVLQLHFNLCDDKQAVTKKLVSLIRKNGTALTTGFVGTPYLLHALSDNGEVELAYELLLRREYPSWLYPVDMGATTIWEHWDGIKPNGDFWSVDMNSFNHYAYGAVCDWLYGDICGIKPRTERNEAGFKAFDIKPLPNKCLGFACAEYNMQYGKISSEWKYTENAIEYRITVPHNTTAYFALPNSAEISVLSEGTYVKKVSL